MTSIETRTKGADRGTVERAFLIADVRGYTRFTRERGDAEAARLAGAFAALARDAVAARGGRVIELRGDEALAVFEAPGQAVRAAVDLVALCAEEVVENPDLPLLVGVGVDAGQAVPLEGGYRGAAINTAARLCSQAAAGQVLVSAALLDRAGEVRGVRSAPHGALELKGFERPLEVVEVRSAVDRAPVPAPELPSPDPLPAELDVVIPLVGRDDEMSWLRGCWRQARRGDGRLVVVSGPAGIGRTRLIAELAAAIDGSQGLVHYAGAGGTAQAVAEAGLRAATSTDVPILVVLDDMDVIGEPLVPLLERVADEVERRPALVVCLLADPDASPVLAGLVERADRDGDGHRRLAPLGAADVRAIIELYAGEAAGDVSVESVLRVSQGIPDRVHELMSEWAEREAARRLEAAAEFLSVERRRLQHGLDFANTVIGLKLARLYTATPADDVAPGACPYKGLASFDDGDSRFFFGRERLVGELAARTVGTGLLAVVGASGSGKSSILAAGLVTSLRAGLLPGSDRWHVASIRPGDHPAAELDAALDVERDAGSRLVLVVDQFEELFSTGVTEAERSACVDALLALAADPDRHVVVLGVRADFYGHCAAYPDLARQMAANHVLVRAMNDRELRRAIELPARRLGVRIDAALVDRLVEEVIDQPGGLPLLSTALVELWSARSRGWLRLDAYERAGGVDGAVARLAEGSYEQLSDRQREIARALFLRLVAAGDDGVVTRRIVHRGELALETDADISAVVARLTADRLLTVTDDTVEVAHEALLREWPRLVEWLQDDAQGRELREHLMQAARRWLAAGRDAGELYRGSRLTATLDWAAGRVGELNEAEHEFLRESRGESEREAERQRRTNRRLRALLVGVSVVTVLAVAAGIVALVQRSAARHQATVALGRQLGAEAVSEPRIDRAMLLARESLLLDRSTQTESTLLATLLRSPAVTATYSTPLTWRPLAVTPSPDRRTIIVQGNDGQLHLYDTTSRMAGRVIPQGYAPAVYVPSTNQVIDTPDGPGNLLRIDARTGNVLRQYAWGHLWNSTPSQALQPVVVTPNGREIVMAWTVANPDGSDGAAYVQRWAVDAPGSGRVPPTVARIGARGVRALAVTTGRVVVASDHVITTLSLKTLRPVSRTKVRSLANAVVDAVSPDGRTLAYGDSDGTVHFVDVASGRVVDGQGAHASDVQDVTFSPDSRLAVSTGDDGLVIVWDPATGAVVERLAGHGGRVTSAAFAADGRTLYSASLDGTVLRWRLSGAGRFGDRFSAGAVGLSGAAADVSDVEPDPPLALGPGGRVLAVRSRNRGVSLYDTDTLRRTGGFTVGHGSGNVVTGLCWSGSRLFVGTTAGNVQVWDVRGSRLGVLHGLSHSVRAVAASADGHLVAAVDATLDPHGQDVSGRLVVWRDGRVLRSVRLPSPGNAVAFSRDGTMLAVAKDSPNARDSGPSVLVYEVAGVRLIHSMRPATGAIAVAFGKGDVLASASWQGIVTLWDATTGAPLGKPSLAAPAPVSSIAFDRSGDRYATAGGSSGGVRLWETSTQQVVGSTFPGGEGQWGSVAFTPDGRRMIVVFSNGSAYRWPVSVDAWAAHACAVAGRNLTLEEWHRYVGSRPYQPTCPGFGGPS